MPTRDVSFNRLAIKDYPVHLKRASMTREEARQYVEHWKRVGPLLEQQEKEELRNYSEIQWMRDVVALLDLSAQFAVPRSESGFVEQQRLFRRLAG